MEESLYIGEYKKNEKLIDEFISSSSRYSNFKFSLLQKKGDVLRITLRKNSLFDKSVIKSHKLTCVVENDLFRTVYIDGNRIFWNSKTN